MQRGFCRSKMSSDSYMQINNIKLSVKIDPISLEKVENLCINKLIIYKKYLNFIVFKAGKSIEHLHTYTLFKHASAFKNSDSKQHVNITRVLPNSISEAILTLQEVLDLFISPFTYVIDNITSGCYLGRQIKLLDFIKDHPHLSKCIRYTPERFPAAFLKKNKQTFLIFTSGKFIILGSKSISEAEIAYRWLKEECACI